MTNVNALVELLQNNPDIITKLTSGSLDASGIVSLLKNKGVDMAKSEVESYIAKNLNLNDLGSIAGSLLGNGSKASSAASVLGGLGSLLGKK